VIGVLQKLVVCGSQHYTSNLQSQGGMARLSVASCYVQELVVYGSQESAEVALDNDAVLYFKPTCVHTTSIL